MLTAFRVAVTAAITASAALIASYAVTPEAQWLLLKLISKWFSGVSTSFLIPLLPAVVVVPTAALTSVIIYLLWSKR